MELGLIGLGRMGGNMTRRLIEGGHQVHVFDPNPAAVERAVADGAVGSTSLEDMVTRLKAPRVVWMMIPAGDPVEQTIKRIVPVMSAGDVLVDGGNSMFKDSMRRAADVAQHNIHYLDCGTSGGIWGLQIGYCLMIGGDKDAFAVAEPIFKTLAPEGGYAHVGKSGAGHYTKMIHNGIEYALLQAYGEGFDIMFHSGFDLDLEQVSTLWNHGSVIRSWLLELAQRAFALDPRLEHIRGYVEDSGEGRWTVFDAIDHNVPAPVITLSLLTRFRSREEEAFSDKVIAALRNQFGGHAVKTV